MDALTVDLYDEEKRAKIEALQWKVGRRLLALGVPVIIEWGAWGRTERDALRLAAREVGAAVKLHYLAASVDVPMERIRRRGMEDPPIKRQAEAFQAPTAEEMALYGIALTLEGDEPPGRM